MSKPVNYGRIRPCIRNNKADLRWLRKMVKRKKSREWKGEKREVKGNG